MAKPSEMEISVALLERHGRTFAGELGIPIEKNTPSPLFMLLYATLLFSTESARRSLSKPPERSPIGAGRHPNRWPNLRGSSAPRR